MDEVERRDYITTPLIDAIATSFKAKCDFCGHLVDFNRIITFHTTDNNSHSICFDCIYKVLKRVLIPPSDPVERNKRWWLPMNVFVQKRRGGGRANE